MSATKSSFSLFQKTKIKFEEIYFSRIVPAMSQTGSTCKRMGLSISFFLWIILCMGLLFTIYYATFNVSVNIIIKNDNNSYVAAVIDYKPFYLYSYEWATLLNLYQYVQIIGQSAQYMADIVVFPECGLFMCGQISRHILLSNAVSVPLVEDSAIPCDNYNEYDEVISRLSCAAKENKIYVAVNIMEKLCPGNCSTIDDFLLYNTEVVFDRNGKIIARYRKYNLYLERWYNGVNQTKEVELVTFTTDFNETFGIMICFDAIFKNPGVTLVREKHVTSMILSAAFSSSLPFLAVSSAEAGWSYALDVNLLASSLPNNNSFAGSNIYFGRNELLSTYMVEYRGSKIIMGVVPKNGAKSVDVTVEENGLYKYSPKGPKQSSFLTDEILNATTTRSLFDINPNVVQVMGLQRNLFIYQSNNFDCSISVVWKNENITVKPNYKLLAYSGIDSFTISSVNNYVEMCGLVLCSEEDEFCEIPSQYEDSSKITFVSINIVATSRKNATVTIPSTLNSDLLAFSSTQYTFNSFLTKVKNKDVNVIEMNLREPSSNLANFGVYTLPQKSMPLKLNDTVLNLLTQYAQNVK